MRRTILVLTILISVVYLIPASVVIESGAGGGSATANLLLVMDEVKKENFGLSSQPVDINNSPVPITAVELEGQLSSNDQTLIGSKTVYAYWDIASVDKVKLSVSITGPMSGETEKAILHWCCYSDDIDDVRHYVGYADNGDYLVDPLTNVSTDDFKSYGSSYVVYDESVNASPSYARIDSVELKFRTDNAYPSDSVPADRYTGTLVLNLETI